MAQTITQLGQGEYTIGSAANGGFMTNKGNIYYTPQTPATSGAASNQNKPAPAAPPPAQNNNPPPSNNNNNSNQSEGVDMSGTRDVDFYINEFGKRVDIDKEAEKKKKEIDEAYGSVFDIYNQAEGNLRGQYPGLIAEADAQAKASRGLLSNEKLSANTLLNNQAQSAQYAQQNQTAEQRRILQELSQANQQRFGGASGAGQAASEIQGREFQRNVYGIGQQAQQAMQQVEQKRQEVDRTYQQGLQQLEVNVQKAKNELQRGFQDKLLEINAGRANTATEKAKMRMEALQALRNEAYQIDMAKFQFATQLQMQREQNQAELQRVSTQYGSLDTANSIDPGSYSSPSPIPSVQTGNTVDTAVGYANPTSRKDETVGGMSYANPNINTSLMSMAR